MSFELLKPNHHIDTETGVVVVTRAGQSLEDALKEIEADESKPPLVIAESIDDEMWRRIAALVGASNRDDARDIILRANREQMRMLNKQARRSEVLSDEEEARAVELEALDAQVTALEEAADVLKVQDPIPDDYRDDKHWSGSASR